MGIRRSCLRLLLRLFLWSALRFWVRIAALLSSTRCESILKRVSSYLYAPARVLATKRVWMLSEFAATLAIAFWCKGGSLLNLTFVVALALSLWRVFWLLARDRVFASYILLRYLQSTQLNKWSFPETPVALSKAPQTSCTSLWTVAVIAHTSLLVFKALVSIQSQTTAKAIFRSPIW